jgi:hypothetical protein
MEGIVDGCNTLAVGAADKVGCNDSVGDDDGAFGLRRGKSRNV